MGLTRVSGDILQTQLNVGVVTASQVNVGSAVTIHSGGFQVGGSDLHSSGLTVQNLNSTGVVTATTFSGNLTGNVNSTGVSTFSTLRVGTAVTISGGIVTATSFYGDGTNLTNTGSTLSAASGSQRVVLTGQTSGTMTASATSSSLSFDASTGTLSATKFSGDGSTLTGIAATTNVVTNSLVVSGITTVAAGSTSAPSISPTGDSNTGIFFPSADTIAFAEGGVEAARFDSSGQLGIGTVTPNGLLSLFKNSGRLLSLRNSTTGSASGDGSYLALNGSDFQISNAESANLIFYTNDTERVRVSAAGSFSFGGPSGAVGFATNSSYYFYAPANGNTDNISFRFRSDGYAPYTLGRQYGLYVTQSGGRYAPQTAIYGTYENQIGMYGTDYIGVHGHLDFQSTASGSRSNGVVGTCNISDWNYQARHCGVRGECYPASVSFLSSYGYSTGNYGGFGGWFQAHGKADSIGVYADAYLDASPGAGAVAIPLACGTNGSELMRLTSAGELWIGYTSDNGNYKLQVNSQIFATSSTIATSDGRYKENVETLNGCVDIVRSLRPVTFTWKEQESIYHPTELEECKVPEVDENGELTGNMVDGTRPRLLREGHNFPKGTQVGFIAQEVQEVIQDKSWLRSIIKENRRPAIKDSDGTELVPEEKFYGIAEGNMISILTSALQEALEKIDDLQARLDAAGL